jgi:hypothetical protein
MDAMAVFEAKRSALRAAEDQKKAENVLRRERLAAAFVPVIRAAEELDQRGVRLQFRDFDGKMTDAPMFDRPYNSDHEYSSGFVNKSSRIVAYASLVTGDRIIFLVGLSGQEKTAYHTAEAAAVALVELIAAHAK